MIWINFTAKTFTLIVVSLIITTAYWLINLRASITSYIIVLPTDLILENIVLDTCTLALDGSFFANSMTLT